MSSVFIEEQSRTRVTINWGSVAAAYKYVGIVYWDEACLQSSATCYQRKAVTFERKCTDLSAELYNIIPTNVYTVKLFTVNLAGQIRKRDEMCFMTCKLKNHYNNAAVNILPCRERG